MCEVTRSNFEEMYEKMLQALQNASFIAFDAEFTSLDLTNNLKPSLSDTAEVRYAKLRRNVSKSSICQLGISAYVPHCRKQNSYLVQTFNCYLFPQSFGPIDARFICQASSMEFLCENRFNFNKFIYEGVSYLNKNQEQVIREAHKLGRLKHACDSIRFKEIDGNELKELRESINGWRCQADFGETKEFTAPVEDVFRYLLLADLKERFDDVFCKYLENNKILVTKTKDKTVIKKRFDEEFEKFFQSLLGFSRIFREISALRKPIVGHNCLTDLLFIFEKFHKSLPEKYKDFKKELNELFPVIYDTKHLSFLLRNVMRNETALFQETRLNELYQMLNSDEGKFYVLHSPFIEHAPGFNAYVNSDHIHEAGYDAYLTGYAISMIREKVFGAGKLGSTEMRTLTFREQLSGIKGFENCVNIARASLRYLNFGGDDPVCRTPVAFVITLRHNVIETISANEVAHDFLPFGSTDVQLENSKRAIVTISNGKRVNDVLCAFKMHRKYKVSLYNATKGSKTENFLKIGCGVVLILASTSIVYLLSTSS